LHSVPEEEQYLLLPLDSLDCLLVFGGSGGGGRGGGSSSGGGGVNLSGFETLLCPESESKDDWGRRGIRGEEDNEEKPPRYRVTETK
jgi:hypothetical protein